MQNDHHWERINQNLTGQEKAFLKYNQPHFGMPAPLENASTRVGNAMSTIKHHVGWLRYVDLLYLLGGEVGVYRDYMGQTNLNLVRTCIVNPQYIQAQSYFMWSDYARRFYERHYLHIKEENRPPIHLVALMLQNCHPFFNLRFRYYLRALREGEAVEEPYPYKNAGDWIVLLQPMGGSQPEEQPIVNYEIDQFLNLEGDESIIKKEPDQ